MPGLSGGFVGVDVFFVISGYLIAAILHREMTAGTFTYAGFYERRARRILPALFAVLLAALVAGAVIQSPETFTALALSAATAVLFVSNIQFLRVSTDYFAESVDFLPLLHTWSLGVEEQFYIFFPLLLALLLKDRGRFLRAGLLIVTATSFMAACIIVYQSPSVAFYLLPFRAWEMGFGAILAILSMPPLRRAALRGGLALLGLVLIVGSVLLLDGDDPFPGLLAAPAVMGAALVIWAGQAGDHWASGLLVNPAAVFCGKLSYSLYLWHWPILSFYRIATNQRDLGFGEIVVLLAVIAVVSYASYRLIETPFRHASVWSGGRSRVLYGYATAGVTVIALCGAVWLSRGFPNRFSPEIARIFSVVQDRLRVLDRCAPAWAEGKMCMLAQDGSLADPMAGAAKVVLWGDSYSHSALPALLSVAAQDGRALGYFGRNACAPLPGLERAGAADRSICSRQNDAALAAILGNPDVETVVLFGRWTWAIEGTPAPQEAGKPVDMIWVGSAQMPPGLRPDGPGNRAAVRASLIATLQQLVNDGKEVIIIGAVPEFGVTIPDAMVAAHRFGEEFGPKSPPMGRYDQTLALLAEVDAMPGVHVVSPLDSMCQPDCVFQQDGVPLFYDDDHFSKTGALQILTPLLAPLLADIAAQSGT